MVSVPIPALRSSEDQRKLRAFVPSGACSVCKWDAIDPPAACANPRCGLKQKIERHRQTIKDRHGWNRS
jgi:hypothetical protein